MLTYTHLDVSGKPVIQPPYGCAKANVICVLFKGEHPHGQKAESKLNRRVGSDNMQDISDKDTRKGREETPGQRDRKVRERSRLSVRTCCLPQIPQKALPNCYRPYSLVSALPCLLQPRSVIAWPLILFFHNSSLPSASNLPLCK